MQAQRDAEELKRKQEQLDAEERRKLEEKEEKRKLQEKEDDERRLRADQVAADKRQ